jgi:hypothetical protein
MQSLIDSCNQLLCAIGTDLHANRGFERQRQSSEHQFGDFDAEVFQLHSSDIDMEVDSYCDSPIIVSWGRVPRPPEVIRAATINPRFQGRKSFERGGGGLACHPNLE